MHIICCVYTLTSKMFDLILIFLGVFVLFYIFLREKLRKGEVIPGPKGLPFIGCAFEFDYLTTHVKFMEYAKKYGPIFRLKMFTVNLVVLNDAQLVRKAFAGEKYKQVLNDRADTFFGDYFRAGKQSLAFMIDGSGAFHKTSRKIFYKALHMYGSGIQQLENNVLIEMTNLIKRIEDKPVFDCSYMVKRSLANIVSLVLKGELVSDSDPDLSVFWGHGTGGEFFLNPYNNTLLTTFPILRFMPGQLRDNFRKQCHVYDRIAQRYFHDVKKTYVPGRLRGVVDVYLDEQRKQMEAGSDVFLTDDLIIAQIVETVDTGIMTTWTTLTNSMLVLCNYPTYQTKIQAELDEVIGKDRAPTYKDRGKCTFFLAFEMEVHRFLPVLPLNLPHVSRSHVEFEGYDIKPNSTIIANIWYINHNEDTWGDPWTFRPERFLDEQGNLLPREHPLCQTQLTFGVGSRLCPGDMFAKTRYFMFLATLLQRWNFEFLPGEEKHCDSRQTDTIQTKVNMRAKPFTCRAKERLH
ncbi:cytochrome P450 1A1-like [Mercenaria mercenaria]|uniref:cytochrome P450 1A1-like n=1 Tax=Mercenaria mercenaria TaxID=6596 RepID=UPI00234F0A04|nr:cytochrome P450 1A1-like [Mercenaria mercenaria]